MCTYKHTRYLPYAYLVQKQLLGITASGFQLLLLPSRCLKWKVPQQTRPVPIAANDGIPDYLMSVETTLNGLAWLERDRLDRIRVCGGPSGVHVSIEGRGHGLCTGFGPWGLEKGLFLVRFFPVADLQYTKTMISFLKSKSRCRFSSKSRYLKGKNWGPLQK